MYSAKGHPASPGWGCPIRTSPDHSLLAAPRGLSQPSTSFIGSWCQGIHRAPLLARRLDLSTSPSRQDQRSQKLPTAQITILRGRRSEACSTTLRFFRYSTEALSSASRGASTINQRSKRHDQLSSGVSTARGHKNSPTFVEPPRLARIVSALCD
jgi:hypothetical protein